MTAGSKAKPTPGSQVSGGREEAGGGGGGGGQASSGGEPFLEQLLGSSVGSEALREGLTEEVPGGSGGRSEGVADRAEGAFLNSLLSKQPHILEIVVPNILSS